MQINKCSSAAAGSLRSEHCPCAIYLAARPPARRQAVRIMMVAVNAACWTMHAYICGTNRAIRPTASSSMQALAGPSICRLVAAGNSSAACSIPQLQRLAALPRSFAGSVVVSTAAAAAAAATGGRLGGAAARRRDSWECRAYADPEVYDIAFNFREIEKEVRAVGCVSRCRQTHLPPPFLPQTPPLQRLSPPPPRRQRTCWPCTSGIARARCSTFWRWPAALPATPPS